MKACNNILYLRPCHCLARTGTEPSLKSEGLIIIIIIISHTTQQIHIYITSHTLCIGCKSKGYNSTVSFSVLQVTSEKKSEHAKLCEADPAVIRNIFKIHF